MTENEEIRAAAVAAAARVVAASMEDETVQGVLEAAVEGADDDAAQRLALSSTLGDLVVRAADRIAFYIREGGMK
jgi:hypothetical protein